MPLGTGGWLLRRPTHKPFRPVLHRRYNSDMAKAKPTWTTETEGWDYGLYSFAASVSTMPIGIRGPLSGPLPEHGWHTPDHGAMGLIMAGATVVAIVDYHLTRARRRD